MFTTLVTTKLIKSCEEFKSKISNYFITISLSMSLSNRNPGDNTG